MGQNPLNLEFRFLLESVAVVFHYAISRDRVLWLLRQ